MCTLLVLIKLHKGKLTKLNGTVTLENSSSKVMMRDNNSRLSQRTSTKSIENKLIGKGYFLCVGNFTHNQFKLNTAQEKFSEKYCSFKHKGLLFSANCSKNHFQKILMNNQKYVSSLLLKIHASRFTTKLFFPIKWPLLK